MPGVPPDAVDNVKRLLKGMFKRGKSKQDSTAAGQSTGSAAAPSTTAVKPASQNPVSADAPAQQPSAAAVHGAPDTNKQLPPTQPDESGPPAPAAAHTAPSSTLPDAASPLAPVSAVEEGAAPAPPPKDEPALPATPAAEGPNQGQTTANKENVAPTTTASTVAGDGEKPPVTEEAPPIKATQPAPGMSATSGPLEDFPSEGTEK